MDLIEKTAYIFIDGGWTKVIVDDDGATSMPLRDGSRPNQATSLRPFAIATTR